MVKPQKLPKGLMQHMANNDDGSIIDQHDWQKKLVMSAASFNLENGNTFDPHEAFYQYLEYAGYE